MSMDVVGALLEQAGFAFMAGVFLWLFLTERKDHNETRVQKSALEAAAKLEAKEVTKEVVQVLNGNATAMGLLSEKIEFSKGRR